MVQSLGIILIITIIHENASLVERGKCTAYINKKKSITAKE